MQLSQAFRVRPKDVVAFVGAGGKTTAMFRLADEMAALGLRVVSTTTTRLAIAQVTRAEHAALLRYDASQDFIARVRSALAAHQPALIVGENVEAEKVNGVPPAVIDEFAALDAVDAVIYEADGARMLPFKAPAAHEPALADSTTLLVPVISITAIGAPLDASHVHRAETVARLAGARIGDAVSPTMAARVIANPAGGLKGRPPAARVIVLINQVENETQLAGARAIARLLLGHKEIGAVAIGAVQNEAPIRETHRRVAAIVLAAGGGTRMPGRIKQLLAWRGKTLIENALGLVATSRAAETVVVLGANAAEIRVALKGAPTRVLLNRDWATGHASSIRVGLNALGREIDAAIFVNADQPFLDAEVIDRIIQRYYETGAPIIAPLYAGKRGSPVLFDRVHFDELMRLQGEQGGRELLPKYHAQIQLVEFADARLALDVDTPDEYEQLIRMSL
jgi:molybdenum cofactor cytidylyltransferase